MIERRKLLNIKYISYRYVIFRNKSIEIKRSRSSFGVTQPVNLPNQKVLGKFIIDSLYVTYVILSYSVLRKEYLTRNLSQNYL